jgi:hypothetical protein
MNTPDGLLPPGRLRGMQIIAGALLAGVVTLLALVLILVFLQNQGAGLAPAGNMPILTMVAGFLFVIQAPLAFLLPRILIRSALRRVASGTWQIPPGAESASFNTDASKLLAVKQTSMILGLALLEGAAFLGCIAYLLEAQSIALGVVVVAVALMLMTFPTEPRVRAWLEQQFDQLAELRQQGDIPADR